MTNEDLQRTQRIERNMEFIVEQQAKFEADIAEVRSAISEVKDGCQAQQVYCGAVANLPYFDQQPNRRRGPHGED